MIIPGQGGHGKNQQCIKKSKSFFSVTLKTNKSTYIEVNEQEVTKDYLPADIHVMMTESTHIYSR